MTQQHFTALLRYFINGWQLCLQLRFMLCKMFALLVSVRQLFMRSGIYGGVSWSVFCASSSNLFFSVRFDRFGIIVPKTKTCACKWIYVQM